MKITGARKAAKESFDKTYTASTPMDWHNWKKAFHHGVNFAKNISEKESEYMPVLLTARGVNPFLIRGAWERIAVTEVLETEFGCNCSIITSEEQFQLAEQIEVCWQCPEGANLPTIFTVNLLNEYKI